MAKDKKSGDVNSEPPKPPALPSSVPVPEMKGIGSELELPGEDLDDLDMPKMPELHKPQNKVETPSPTLSSKSAPPLFVKVDKYEDVIKNLQELRSYSLNLRDALDALADIEKELKVGMDIAHKALDKVNSILSSLDAKLLRTGSINIEDELKAPREVEGYIKNVYGQIEKLKSELKAIE